MYECRPWVKTARISDIMSCSLTDSNQRSRGTNCLHLQGQSKWDMGKGHQSDPWMKRGKGSPDRSMSASSPQNEANGNIRDRSMSASSPQNEANGNIRSRK